MQPILERRTIARRHPSHDLKAELRRAVAIGGQGQVFEHHIGQAAIGRGLTLDRLDQGIGGLIGLAAIEPHDRPGQVQRLPIGPDPTQAINRPLAQGHREGQAVAKGLGAWTALTAAAGLAGLFELRRPDHLTRNPRPAKDGGNRRPFRDRGQAHLGQTRPDLTGRRQTLQGGIVDRGPNGRANRPAERTAERRAEGGKNKLSHISPSDWERRNALPAAFATKAPASFQRRLGPNRRG